MMADLRFDAPKTIGGGAVTEVRDYGSGIAKNLVNGTEAVIALPKSNVLEFVLGEKGSVIVRPSGTEPKVKFYYTAVGKNEASAQDLLAKMMDQMSK